MPKQGLIYISPGKVSIDGSETSASTIASDLGPTQRWTLVISAPTPLEEVAPIFQALSDSGRDDGTIVLGIEANLPPAPRDPELLAHFATLEDDERLRVVDATYGKCPAALGAFQRLSHTPPEDRCTEAAREFSKALEDCGCEGEAGVLTLLYSRASDLPVTSLSAVLSVTLAPTGPPVSGSTWGNAVAQLKPDALAQLWVSG